MTGVRAWVLMVVLLTSTPEARARLGADRDPPHLGGRPAMEGVASWYGKFHDGKLMANGRRFRMNGLSAASRLLPLGTRVRVINLDNGKHVDLEITDRGPYVAGRILDVSLGAAKQLRMVDEGLARVRIELI